VILGKELYSPMPWWVIPPPPGVPVTAALVELVNPQTGERWTAPSGGYSVRTDLNVDFLTPPDPRYEPPGGWDSFVCVGPAGGETCTRVDWELKPIHQPIELPGVIPTPPIAPPPVAAPPPPLRDVTEVYATPPIVPPPVAAPPPPLRDVTEVYAAPPAAPAAVVAPPAPALQPAAPVPAASGASLAPLALATIGVFLLVRAF